MPMFVNWKQYVRCLAILMMLNILTIDGFAILLLTQMQLNFGSFFRWSCVLWFLGLILQMNM